MTMRTVSLVLLFLVATGCGAASSAGPGAGPSPDRVGGACSYDEFAGTCTITQVEPAVLVQFSGVVDGQPVVLEGNEVDSASPLFPKREVGTAASCTLGFIKQGTCTPCTMTGGQCGQAAWDLFRSRRPSP